MWERYELREALDKLSALGRMVAMAEATPEEISQYAEAVRRYVAILVNRPRFAFLNNFYWPAIGVVYLARRAIS